MKETVNVNIASQAFTLDDDAYAVLRRYLDDIRRRLPQEDNNTMEDVESAYRRLFFRERLSSPMMVVSLASVQYAMEQLGQPDDFGECPSRPHGRLHGERIGEPEPAPAQTLPFAQRPRHCRHLRRTGRLPPRRSAGDSAADTLPDPLRGPLDLDLHHSGWSFPKSRKASTPVNNPKTITPWRR